MKVFLDANVLFSASLSEYGAAQALLVAAHVAQAQCVSSDYAWGEALRNLALKAPQGLARLGLIEALVARVSEPAAVHVEAAQRAGVVAKDAPVLAAALQCGAAMFVTGDMRHFGHLFGQHIDGVLVLSLRAALDHLAGPAKSRRAARPRGIKP